MATKVEKQVEEFNMVEIPVEKLRTSKYQPDSRNTEASTRNLSVAISEHGLLQPPVVKGPYADGTFETIIGHGRVIACKAKGDTHIWCNVKPVGTDSRELFRSEGNSVRKLTMFAWLENWAKGGKVPTNALKLIKHCLDVFPRDPKLSFLREKHMAPNCGLLIKDLHHQMQVIAREEDLTCPQLTTTGYWFVNNKMYRQVWEIKTNSRGKAWPKEQVRRIMRCITKGKALADAA